MMAKICPGEKSCIQWAAIKTPIQRHVGALNSPNTTCLVGRMLMELIETLDENSSSGRAI
jgi:hypothetical protein